MASLSKAIGRRKPGVARPYVALLVLVYLAQLAGGAIHFLAVDHVVAPGGHLAHVTDADGQCAHDAAHAAVDDSHTLPSLASRRLQSFSLDDCDLLAVNRELSLVSRAVVVGLKLQPIAHDASLFLADESLADQVCRLVLAPKQSPPLV